MNLEEEMNCCPLCALCGTKGLTHERNLEEVARWACALVGDLIAADEDPTHFISWFALREALELNR